MSVPQPRGPIEGALAVPLALRPPQEGRVLGRPLRPARSRARSCASMRRAGRSSSASTTRCATSDAAARRISTSSSRGRPAGDTRPADARSTSPRSGDVVLDAGQTRRLAALPPLVEGAVGAVLVALEAKAAMTAHCKARPRLYDELNSSHLTVHGASSQALAVGFVMVNASPTLRQPGSEQGARRRDRRGLDASQPADAAARSSRRSARSRDGPGIASDGFDGLGIVVVSTARTTAHAGHARRRPARAAARRHLPLRLDDRARRERVRHDLRERLAVGSYDCAAWPRAAPRRLVARRAAPDAAPAATRHAAGTRAAIAPPPPRPPLPRRLPAARTASSRRHRLPARRLAVFVDGCFWHGCPEHGTWPKANADWWREKIEANRRPRRDTDQRLEAGMAGHPRLGARGRRNWLPPRSRTWSRPPRW